MRDILLINKDLFVDYSPVTYNTNIDEFYSYILVSQQLYILPILGQALYDELIDEIAENDLSEENSALILKIAPALAYYSIYQGLPFHYLKIVNKGLTAQDSPNSGASNLKDVNSLRTDLMNVAESFVDMLIQFLCECKESYPLWRPKNINCCDKYIKLENGSANVKYSSGIYFKRKTNNCGCGCK